MRRAFQQFILFGYQIARSSGVLSTAWGRRLSKATYSLYKTLFEPSIEHLCFLVHPGTSVVDVGANVGFFTLKFSKWISDGGRVIAIEPEPANLSMLKQAISRNRAANIDVIEAAAAEEEGELFLACNPTNPADHRLAEQGIPVHAVTIDGLLEARGWPPISLIKIDVQGAEPRTLAGAQETISRFHPAIFMEIDDSALRSAGFSADALIDTLRSQGYALYGAEKGAIKLPLSNNDALLKCRGIGYADFVFILENQ
jgi:FkbM family methyltransferase